MLVQCPGYVFVQYPGRYLMIDMPGFAGFMKAQIEEAKHKSTMNVALGRYLNVISLNDHCCKMKFFYSFLVSASN